MERKLKENMHKVCYAEIDQVSKESWTEIILQFDDATVYQTWSYGAVRWGEKNLSHFVLKKEGEVVGAAQLCIKKIPLIGSGIAYIPWGPLWRKKGRTRNPEILKDLINILKEEYAVHHGLLLRIAPHIVNNEHEEMQSIFENACFSPRKNKPPYRTLMLDITPTLQELRKGLDQKWRNQLNRAEKNNLEVYEGVSDELYQKFMDLQNEMHERKKFTPGINYEEFRVIQKNLPDALKMKIFVCEYKGKPVTATIGSAIGDTGIYLLGATGNEGLQLKGAYLSQWLMIRWMKEQGCSWYDLGGINPEKNPGVFHFKSGLSARDVYHVGHFDINSSSLSSFIVNFGEFIKTAYNKANTYHV